MNKQKIIEGLLCTERLLMFACVERGDVEAAVLCMMTSDIIAEEIGGAALVKELDEKRTEKEKEELEFLQKPKEERQQILAERKAELTRFKRGLN